jgi:hypothetical protein
LKFESLLESSDILHLAAVESVQSIHWIISCRAGQEQQEQVLVVDNNCRCLDF